MKTTIAGRYASTSSGVEVSKRYRSSVFQLLLVSNTVADHLAKRLGAVAVPFVTLRGLSLLGAAFKQYDPHRPTLLMRGETPCLRTRRVSAHRGRRRPA